MIRSLESFVLPITVAWVVNTVGLCQEKCSIESWNTGNARVRLQVAFLYALGFGEYSGLLQKGLVHLTPYRNSSDFRKDALYNGISSYNNRYSDD